MTFQKISSHQNDLVKKLVNMRKKRQKTLPGQFLVEGLREAERALLGGFQMSGLFFVETLLSSQGRSLVQQGLEKCPRSVFEVTRSVYEKIAVRENSDGLIFLFKEKEFDLSTLKSGKKRPFYLALSGIEKPGNLGAIMRVADGAGVDAVVLLDGCVDQFSANSIRASVGSVFTTPIAHMSQENFYLYCLDSSISMHPAILSVESKLYSQVDSKKGIAFILGNEATGVDSFWKSQRNLQPVLIPMQGVADSLNVSVAAAVLSFEVLRQRNS